MIFNLGLGTQETNHVLVDFSETDTPADDSPLIERWLDDHISISVYSGSGALVIDTSTLLTAEVMWGFEYFWLEDVFEYDHPLEFIEGEA
jgi:hypothetical protein